MIFDGENFTFMSARARSSDACGRRHDENLLERRAFLKATTIVTMTSGAAAQINQKEKNDRNCETHAG